MPLLTSLFLDPDLRIHRHETQRIHLEFSNEFPTRTLIPVEDVVNSPIYLLKGLKGEPRKPQPRRLHLRLLTNRQVKSTNRQEICRWAEVQVQIKASRHITTLNPIDMPGSGSIDRHIDIDGLVTDPPGNSASSRQPLSITYDSVIKPTRLLLVLKYRYACWPGLPSGSAEISAVEVRKSNPIQWAELGPEVVQEKPRVQRLASDGNH